MKRISKMTKVERKEFIEKLHRFDDKLNIFMRNYVLRGMWVIIGLTFLYCIAKHYQIITF